MRKISKALDKMMNMLCDYGFSVGPECFTISKGYWTHKHQDCLAWEFSGKLVGQPFGSLPIGIDSWDTISQCSRYGFWLLEGSDGYGQYTAYAKLPGRYQPGTKKPVFKGTPNIKVITEQELKIRHLKNITDGGVT